MLRSLSLVFLVGSSAYPTAFTAHAALSQTHGVPPALLARYDVTLKGHAPPSRWTCLDGKQEIAWSAVNNDYCDCADGSDEPGTSACPNSTFYCNNEGHIGASIRSSYVNDGLCEPDCCDGSDELPGLCPNRCEAIGKEYRTKLEAEMKIRKTGSKLRSSYISFAKKEKRRLEDLVASTARDVAAQEKEVTKLKDILERTESLSAVALEAKKQSPLYQSLITHSTALKSLRREHEKLQEKEKTLSGILDALRSGYNPNYQDMAVLEAVRGYEFYAGLSPVNDRDKAEDGSGAEGGEGDTDKSEEEDDSDMEEEGLWSKEQLDNELGKLLYTDYEGLLMEHDQYTGSENTDSLLFDPSAYIPDSIYPYYENVKDTFVGLLETFGIAKAIDDAGPDTSKARKTLQDAEGKLNSVKKEKENAQRDLTRLFDPEWYGKDGEWKKLDKLCIEKDTGEYTYEVCLFDQARQKPNKGGQQFSLGNFRRWNNAPGVEPGSIEYYSKMYYKGGARCWNGPERSVTVEFSCGTENMIYAVAEPEKCEYQFTGTSPALCHPLSREGKGSPVKEEL